MYAEKALNKMDDLAIEIVFFIVIITLIVPCIDKELGLLFFSTQSINTHTDLFSFGFYGMGLYEYVIIYTTWLGIIVPATLITTFIVFYFLSKKRFEYEVENDSIC